MMENLNPVGNTDHLKFGEIEMINFNGYWSTTDFAVPALKNINIKI